MDMDILYCLYSLVLTLCGRKFNFITKLELIYLDLDLSYISQLV